MKRLFVSLFCALLFVACSVSYSFQGTSIDYTKIKTMEIRDFTNHSPLLPTTLVIQFNEHMKDVFTRSTKLSFVDTAGDLELEGEFVRYDLTPMSIKEDAMASETRLTVAVRIRFRNNINSNEDKEETISVYRDFDSNRMLTEVEQDLMNEIQKEMVDQIFNTTLSNW